MDHLQMDPEPMYNYPLPGDYYPLPPDFQQELLNSGNPVLVQAVEEKWWMEDKRSTLVAKIYPLSQIQEITEDQISLLKELCNEIQELDKELGTLFRKLMALENVNLTFCKSL
jgi:hypothetical protein